VGKAMLKETGIVALPQMYVILVVQFKGGMSMSLEYMRVIYQIQHRCTSFVKRTVEYTHYKLKLTISNFMFGARTGHRD
jgi:hypothetical protein